MKSAECKLYPHWVRTIMGKILKTRFTCVRFEFRRVSEYCCAHGWRVRVTTGADRLELEKFLILHRFVFGAAAVF